MSSSVGLMEFYVAEAGEYIERLDSLLVSAGAPGPDAAALLRHTRALRGSSTMFRRDGIARVARTLERVAYALRDGALRWDAAVAAALREAIDSLAKLVRSAGAWSDADETQAAAHAAALERLTDSTIVRPRELGGSERVIPIAELFPDGPGPHVLFAAPLGTADTGVVPIEALLYRGRAALVRAVAVRDEIRQRDGTPSSDALAELFDLLDLAAAE